MAATDRVVQRTKRTGLGLLDPASGLSALYSPFMEAGLDSLGTIELRNALGAVFGVELAPTAVLDYPNVAALAGHLAGIVLPTDASFSADAPCVVPLERWDVDAFVARPPNAFEARFGAFVSGAQLFDAAAFGITSSEATLMDPQQRLLLQQAAQALYQQRAATGDELVCTHGGAFAAPERTSVMHSGISSFAFQGTNAHMLLSQHAGPPQQDAPCKFVKDLLLWQHHRYWTVYTFLVDQAAPVLSFLHDHQVGGQVLLPGTAMFDACVSAASTMANSPHPAGMSLQHISIISPVVLAAGVNDFGALQDMDVARLSAVTDVKMMAVAAFQQAALPLASHLLFSSTSSVWSQSGAGAYAAGNAYLDAHASASQHAGLPGTATQFGPFEGTGMAAMHVDGLATLGLKMLQPRQIFECHFAAGNSSNLLYGRIDAPRFFDIYSAKGRK
ncbi:type I polyketide synthase [Micractinium conductrix]|uniref:Type I polyketide synthase n=1 Tax=Micractinium conductrix TaxID=554055 RepID=A0A2P6V3Z2_9CHLO|nr:type I polyketide synthase [Micractinium conductrix]|eukprot:PSC68804.1 type I polyketide synthase [Micractinium conductrix]